MLYYVYAGDFMNQKKWYYTFLGLFYGLNIFNTYMVTTSVLNRYLIPFRRHGLLELNAIIGNIAALSILLLIGFLIFKKRKSRMTYLVIVTLLLNISIFSIGIFTKYYSTMFSIYEMTLFNNPAAELAGSIFVEALVELYQYYRIVVFIPVMVLFGIYTAYFRMLKKQGIIIEEKTYPLTRLLSTFLLLASLVVSLSTTAIVKENLDKRWPISAERALFGIQSAGLYNYYIGQMMGINLSSVSFTLPSLTIYNTYNKNQASYTNFFNQTYSNTLDISQASTVQIDPSLLNGTSLNGVFEDKNIVVFHLESFNHFLLNEANPYLDATYFSNLKALLNESYVLDNFYTNVGLGNSSDAEFSVMTGLYPTGDTTIYWNYNKTKYVFDALPKQFSDRYSASLHGDVRMFYNRPIVHEEMFGFNDYFYFDENETNFNGTKNGVYVFPDFLEKNTPDSPWLSDFSLLDWTETLINQHDAYFLFPITIQPHTPYQYDPYPNQFTKDTLDVSSSTLKYINYETYYDLFFEQFIEMTKRVDNTVYIFYSDHGSGIPKVDLETLLGKELTNLEYKHEMIKTLAFIYAPDDNDDTSGVAQGLITGVQPLVRSQVDIYRTVLDLFGKTSEYQYYGVNMLSDERTFSIDTRAFDIVTDDYLIISKFMNSDQSPNDMNTLYFVDETEVIIEPFDLYEKVLLFKKRMDIALNLNLYQHLKNI